MFDYLAAAHSTIAAFASFLVTVIAVTCNKAGEMTIGESAGYFGKTKLMEGDVCKFVRIKKPEEGTTSVMFLEKCGKYH